MEIGRLVAKFFAAVIAALLAGSLTGCEAAANDLEAMESAPGAAAGGQYPAVDAASALDQLTGIPVKGRAPKTGFSRDESGPALEDTDHNGYDTSNDILAQVHRNHHRLRPWPGHQHRRPD